jgi:hypothetical protein
LLAHGRRFFPGTPASSTTKTGRHDIAEILHAESGVKTPNIQIKSNLYLCLRLATFYKKEMIKNF